MHLGRLIAQTHCEIISLDAAKFRSITFRMDAYQSCQKYAKAYQKWIVGLEADPCFQLSDILGDFDAAQEMAQNAFEGMNDEGDRGLGSFLRRKLNSSLSSLSEVVSSTYVIRQASRCFTRTLRRRRR